MKTPLALNEEDLRKALNNAGGRLQQHENYIVRAVNSHEALLALAKLALEFEDSRMTVDEVKKAKKLIAQAEGK